MKEWEEVKLKDICEFEYGYNLPSRKRKEGIYPVYGSSKVVDCHNEYAVKGPGIIIGRKGTIGKIQYSSEDFFPIDTTYYIKHDPKKVDLKYLFYRLKVLGLDSLNSDAAVPGLNRNNATNQKIKLPSLSTQSKIQEILFGYDEIIESNYAHIILLEEYLKITFEEWFLRYRINHTKLDIDKYTQMPLGWKTITVGEYVETISKGPPIDYKLGDSKGVPVLNQSCIRNGEIELTKVLFAKDIESQNISSYLKINDILINSMGDGTLGRVSRNLTIKSKMIIHNCITYLRSKNCYSQYYLFYYLSLHQEYFENIAQGSTGQSTLKKELIEKMPIPIPEKFYLDRFDKKSSLIWAKIAKLKKQNNLLKEARDILLPRLMSGFINTDNLKTSL